MTSPDIEPFGGFDISDEEVCSGSYRDIAIELKHLFESLVIDADEKNEELFLASDLVLALTNFVRVPSSFTLCSLLAVSPTLYEPIVEITRLVAPSILNQLPVIC